LACFRLNKLAELFVVVFNNQNTIKIQVETTDVYGS
jgi:hypothetical protein